MPLLRAELVVEHEDGRREVYSVALEELRLTMNWRMGEYAGVLRVEPGRLVIDVREGLAAGLRSMILRRGPGVGDFMEAGRLLACETGMEVEMRVHGVKLATLRCEKGS